MHRHRHPHLTPILLPHPSLHQLSIGSPQAEGCRISACDRWLYQLLSWLYQLLFSPFVASYLHLLVCISPPVTPIVSFTIVLVCIAIVISISLLLSLPSLPSQNRQSNMSGKRDDRGHEQDGIIHSFRQAPTFPLFCTKFVIEPAEPILPLKRSPARHGSLA